MPLRVTTVCFLDRIPAKHTGIPAASPFHLCSNFSHKKVAVSRNRSLQEVACGSVIPAALPHATLSWPIPVPQDATPEVGFKLMLELA